MQIAPSDGLSLVVSRLVPARADSRKANHSAANVSSEEALRRAARADYFLPFFAGPLALAEAAGFLAAVLAAVLAAGFLAAAISVAPSVTIRDPKHFVNKRPFGAPDG